MSEQTPIYRDYKLVGIKGLPSQSLYLQQGSSRRCELQIFAPFALHQANQYTADGQYVQSGQTQGRVHQVYW